MKHFTVEQRYKLEILLQQKIKKSEIALKLNVHISTIYNEINRNSDLRNNVYKADLAERKCKKRHLEKSKNQVFDDDLKQYVKNGLKQFLSPEQIVGRSKLEAIKCVSHETIYKMVWKDKKQKGDLYKCLRNKGKLYRKRGACKDKRGQIIDRNPIENRPIEVEQKQRIGDLEIDLVIGKNHKGALLTINDRATGMLFAKKLNNKDAEKVKESTIELLQNYKPLLHTITSDNGKEFSKHKEIAAELDIGFYFANAYCSWERGANENLNGLVRQYFPKGLNFDSITERQVNEMINQLNNRPRKRYGFKTPNEVYLQKLTNNQNFAFIN